jgi:hypothetical protein
VFSIPQHNTLTNAPNNATHGVWALRGAGSLAAAPPPQIFYVPDGVYTVWVSMCGGGGSPGGSDGGATTFGNALTATGGSAAVTPAGTPNGQNGHTNSIGGSTPFGFGGIEGGPGKGWGSGGATGAGSGAASGGWYMRHAVTVTPGMSFLCTVGAGGTGGQDGASGLIIVEW